MIIRILGTLAFASIVAASMLANAQTHNEGRDSAPCFQSTTTSPDNKGHHYEPCQVNPPRTQTTTTYDRTQKGEKRTPSKVPVIVRNTRQHPHELVGSGDKAPDLASHNRR